MKQMMRLIIVMSGILIHIFSYGSTALVRGSRRAIRASGNNLMNVAPPSITAINGQYLPINSNNPLQPMQNYQFNNQAISSKPIKIQQQSFSTQSDSQNLVKIPSEDERASYFKNFNKDNFSAEEIAKLVDATQYFSYKDLHDVSNAAERINDEDQRKSLHYPELMTFYARLRQAIGRFNGREIASSERIDWLHRLLDNESLSINFPLIERLSLNQRSRGELTRMILAAQKNAGNKPLDTLSIRRAILDIEYGEKKPMMDKSQTDYKTYNWPQPIVIHYKKGMLRSLALHEASHAIAQIESLHPSFISTLTIEPRIGFNGMMGNMPSYANAIGYLQSNQQKLQSIIVSLAGVVGEQVFDTYRHKDYSDSMLTHKNDIYRFLTSRIGGGPDLEYAQKIAGSIASDKGFHGKDLHEAIDEIIADCYMQTYKFISKNKDVIEKLADAAMEKGTLHEDEIYAIVDKTRPLHDFEHGAMTESESAALSQYRFPGQTMSAKITNLIDALPQNNMLAKNNVVPDETKQEFGYGA